MNTSPKIYSYIRFSSPEQAKGHSLDRQLNYAKEYAKKHGMVLDESLTMRDEGLSAYHQNHIKRGAFGIFLKAIESGKIPSGSILIIEALDRISRAEPIEAQAILSQIIMAGITVITASDGKVYEREIIKKDPMSLVYSLLIFVRANEESETKSKRVRQSILDRIKQWKEHGHGNPIRVGHDPIWVKYNTNTQRFDLVEKKAEVVKLIISLYLKGWSFVKITKFLTENTCPLYDNRWNVQVVFRLISDPRLAGEKRICLDSEEYVVKEYFPKIITTEDFIDLQQVRKNRASTKAQGKIAGIFTGMKLCFCGYCSYSLNSQNHMHKLKSGTGISDGYRRIVCSSKLNNHHGCPGSSSTSIVPIEKSILEYCSDKMEITSMLSECDKLSTLKLTISSLKQKSDNSMERIKTAEKSIINLISQGEDISPIINRTIEKFRLEHEGLLKQMSEAQEQLIYQNRHKSSDIIEAWDSLKTSVYDLDEEPRLIIRQLVKRTFKRIDIFLHGMNLSDQKTIKLLKRSLGTNDNTIDMILTFHNNKTRVLSIDKKTGSWVKGGDVTFNEALMTQALVDSQKIEVLEHS